MTRIFAGNDVVAGRYAISEFIGEGGMQEVYRADDLSLGRVVALKVPKNSSAEKRFQRSAAMSAKVTHPNVAKTYDYLVHEGRQVLVEELVRGMDLGDLLDRRFVTLDPHLSAHVLHHLARGLNAVHRVGVTHRDLKPKNIMLSDDPDLSVIKITDFGIAKMAEAEIQEGVKDDESTMKSKTVLGAIPYMAPEVLQNRDDVSMSADIWSIGAMLYTFLIGRPPFGSGIPAVVAILSAKSPPAQPAALSGASQFGQLVRDLWGIISSCLSIDPALRPTAAQLVEMCDKLCYSRSSRRVGIIDSFRPKSGQWGFISPSDGAPSVFFHANSFWGDAPPAPGKEVCFSSFPGTPSNRAHPVLLLRG